MTMLFVISIRFQVKVGIGAAVVVGRVVSATVVGSSVVDVSGKVVVGSCVTVVDISSIGAVKQPILELSLLCSDKMN